MIDEPKQNSGPRITVFHKKPKSRSPANKVWGMFHSVYGQPPSWMRMIPARRWTEDLNGEPLFTTTSRWEVSLDDEGNEIVVFEGAAKKVVEMIRTGDAING